MALQLASGAALLAGVGETGLPAIRWYRTATPALVIGAGQPLEQVDRAACAAAGVTVHRRSSGGTAVLITPDMLMLDMALPRNHRLFSNDVTESYRWFGEVCVAFLHSLGIIDARLIPPAEARDDTQALDPLTRRTCFGGFSPYEVMVGHRKIVGLAQVRRRSGIVIQAGIYIHWRPGDLVNVLALEPVERMRVTQRLHGRAVGLGDLVPMEQPVEEVEQRVRSAFVNALSMLQGVVLVDAAWSNLEYETRMQTAATYAPVW